jgi:Zn-dependent peptidase ImmA (M78 family)/transcriptional regulator with XRE-family HTH domain
VAVTPSRIALARRRRGLTKTRLADEIGVSVRSVAAFESGERRPSAETLRKIAEVLSFPKPFFEAADLEEVSVEAASFRALSKMTASQRNSAFAAGALAFALHDWIDGRFRLPVTDIPRISATTNPETAAAIVRSEWGLGSRPIKKILPLLESKGIRVYSLAEDCAEVDAFSMWRRGNGFIFLNHNKSAEHSRFDAAHELAHLVLHGGDDVPHGKAAEDQANSFAGAFLMPRDQVLAKLPRRATLEHLLRLKKSFRVSVSALAYRGHELGVFTDWHYRRLCVEISERGWRRSEPQPIQRERSQVLDKVFQTLRREGIGKAQVAESLGLHVQDVDKLVFGLALIPLDGSPTARPARSDPPAARKFQPEVLPGGTA